jgi:uncharacterized SAM-binding protein YcdF (DUF218 family)
MILLGFAIFWLWRRRRETRKRLLLLTFPYLLLVIMSVPAVSYLLLGSLEWHYPPLEQRPADASAIVVLAGEVNQVGDPQSPFQLGKETYYRCLKALELYRQGKPCSILVSGGISDPHSPGPPCADLMRDLLLKWGVESSDVIVENQSRTTFENAVESSNLLRERNFHKIILVTNANHMVRAHGCFQKKGMEVVPSGCRFGATPNSPDRFGFVPSVEALKGSESVCHEWLGLAWYWLQGRI